MRPGDVDEGGRCNRPVLIESLNQRGALVLGLKVFVHGLGAGHVLEPRTWVLLAPPHIPGYTGDARRRRYVVPRHRGGEVSTAESDGAPTDTTEIRDQVAALLPEIRARGDEVAALRQLPSDLVASLQTAGAFRIAMPRSWGGPELPLREQIEIVEMLATADPSVGWCVMIGSDGGFYSSFLDDESGRELWPDLDVPTAGWVFPAGRAREVADGYVVQGHWSFGSGCTSAGVIGGGCLVVDDDGEYVLGADDQPRALFALAPASSFEILDTWHTTGLAGSGSNDYRCRDLFVPRRHTFRFTDDVQRDGALYAFRGAFVANMQGVGLGLARRALDEAIEIASTKVLRPQMVDMRDVARVREAIADAEMLLRSARAYVYDSIDAAWARLAAGGEMTTRERADLALSRVQSFRVAKQVALAMVQLTGTQAIYRTSVLDRLVRDAITINQHVAASAGLVEAVGGMLLGSPPQGVFGVLV